MLREADERLARMGLGVMRLRRQVEKERPRFLRGKAFRWHAIQRDDRRSEEE